MNAEEYQERQVTVGDWPINLSSYRLGGTYYCKADNISPGAALARASGASRQEAEEKALQRAGELLVRTRRHPV
jgi:hypothetical protein